jgi:CDP-paratose 2-epimerase
MNKILITGGAGFVGSNIAIALKDYFNESEIVALDNLHRKGSELNIPRLETNGIEFVNGDVRNSEDLQEIGEVDLLIECSAEPSVLAGRGGDTEYLIQTNLQGAINCAEVCRHSQAPMIFLSTSRVYPVAPLLDCELKEADTRFELLDDQKVPGLSSNGISEEFPMKGVRSLYGGTKYAAEVMLEEYRDAFSIPIVINRCGVLAGPWQFGKADQGIAAFWTASHYLEKPLKYIGFGGSGKQVRDMLHINDFIRLILMQVEKPATFANDVYNVGGGNSSSASLLELTDVCQAVTGKSIEITPEPKMRYADIPVYISDNRKITSFCGWKPEKNINELIEDIHQWISDTPGVKELFS